MMMKSLADKYGVDIDVPFRNYLYMRILCRELLYGNGVDSTIVEFEFDSKFSGRKKCKLYFEGVVTNISKEGTKQNRVHER